MFTTVDWNRLSHAWRRSTKTLLVMKLALILLLGFFMNVHAAVHSQTITLSGDNLSIRKVFSEVKKQTGFLVAGRADLLDELGTVSVSVKEMELEEFLSLIFRNKPVSYRLDKKTIVLSRKQQALDAVVQPTPELPEQSKATGTVLAEDGAPLSGVSVVVKKTKKGTVTDAAGKFSIAAAPNDILSFSFIGYASQEVRAVANSMIVRLKLANSILDETQIIAYGKTSRRLTTGNIGVVKAEEIERQPVLTVLEALIGKVPGLQISHTNGNSSAPMMLTIRGTNSVNPNVLQEPMYVVDGIPWTVLNTSSMMGSLPWSTGAVQGGMPNVAGENPLISINPRDIESISVLKDADATAIYGSRGANGVILITTKKAQAGPTRFKLSVAHGITTMRRYPNLLSTPDYIAMRKEAFRNDNIVPDQWNAPDLTRWDTTKFTDWQRLFVGVGSMTSVNAGVSGGMNQTTYGISAGYTATKELMNNGNGNRVGTLRSTFAHTSKDQRFGFNITNNLSLTEVNSLAIGNLGMTPPNAPDIYNEDGEFNWEPFRGQNRSSFPFANLKRASESNTMGLQSSLNMQYEILRGLTLSVNAGYNFSHNQNATYYPEAANDPVFVGYSQAVFGESTNRNWMVDPQLAYNTYIGKGRLTTRLIANMQNVRTRGETMSAQRFPNDALMKSYMNGDPAFLNITENIRHRKTVSTAAIINYAWDNKYVININARRDGSSQFGPGKRFGNFWSVGLAWVASDEKWLRKVLPSWVSFLKFRGSHGITGSDGVNDYEFLSRWSRSLSSTNNIRTLFRYGGVESFHVVKPLNQQFQWEQTQQTEYAASLAFLDNRINVDLSYYRKVTGNQLTNIPTPLVSGFENVVGNSEAKVANTGIEITMNGRLVQQKDWGINVNFNFYRNRNELLAFPNLENSPLRGNLQIGKSLSTTYVLKFTGIDPLTGNATYEDRNKDGVITVGNSRIPQSDVDDRYIEVDMGTTRYAGGFGFQAYYKGFSVSASFMYENRLRLHPYLEAVPGDMKNMLIPADLANNHWRKPGDQAKYPRYTTSPGSLKTLRGTDAEIVNGSRLEMINLSLDYRVPASWAKLIGMKDASISARTQNLFVVSAYDFITTTANLSPIPRNITLAVSFNF